MEERPLHLLITPGFLAGLVLLLLNDFVLKQQFHNAATGKLSDVAGLFIFPLFWTALFPCFKTRIYLATIAGFAFWKSPFSKPLIDTWNLWAPIAIRRTLDYTDLLALLVLPLSFVYGIRLPRVHVRRPVIYAIAAISLFAFTATQFSNIHEYGNEYPFPISKKELLKRMRDLSKHEVHDKFWNGEAFQIVFDDCTERAWIKVRENAGQTVVKLAAINFRCPGGGDPVKMRAFFELEFIEKLRAPLSKNKSEIDYIWPALPNEIPTPKPK